MAEALGLVTLHCSSDVPTPTPKTIESIKDLQQLYSDQLDQIGNLPGKAKLYVKDGDPPRKYSIHMKLKLKAELDSVFK